ncbi:MAG TPA: M36 family metallopeptidase, partial [Chthoniobacterales bacterium]
TDDDAEGEYVTGEFDVGIRRLPVTNYRWSYASINGSGRTRRDQQPPDASPGSVPFEVHDVGEVWSATLWDMRELLIMKDPNGVFFDGTRRLGSGTNFFIGYRQVQSTDTLHPINYRASYNTNIPATINPSQAIVRPGLIANEIASRGGDRKGPLSTAVANGAQLADRLVLRGMQLSPCNPSFVDSRDSILLADREMTGGENQALIWRAFASHGVGVLAASSSGAGDEPGSQSVPVVIEDFSVPAAVTTCEAQGPLAAPTFVLSNTKPNVVTVTIASAAAGTTRFIISRAISPNGPFTKIADIPASQLSYDDDNGGAKLQVNQTFYYQVRASRDASSICVSSANTQNITVTNGVLLLPPPSFAGASQVLNPLFVDPNLGGSICNRLIVNWDPALSTNLNADIVYDIYRTDKVDGPGVTATEDPTFTPSVSNRIATGVRGTSFTDSGLELNHVYYYIVQARDLNNAQIDTNNTGNKVAKFNAPRAPGVTATPVFALENFEAATANMRFTPPLVDSPTPDQGMPAFQRVPNVMLNSANVSSVIYAPNLDPGSDGAPSDFSTTIGPITLTPNSILEFDHKFSAEETFDGGLIEIKVGGDATFVSNPYPDNVTTFDLGYYIVEGGYTGKLNGTLAAGVILSPLQGRRAYTGAKGLHHVRVPLEAFAPGGVNNPGGLPVRIRFRMTSDVQTTAGALSGWYIDNLAINNLDPASCAGPLSAVSRKVHGPNQSFDIPLPLNEPAGVECRTEGAARTHHVIFRFAAPVTVGSAAVTPNGTGRTAEVDGPPVVSSDGREVTVNLKNVSDAQTITVRLLGVNNGTSTIDVGIPMGVLVGDTSGDRSVNSGDAQQTRSRSGQVTNEVNFRTDVNVDGAVNSGDAFIVRRQSGQGL